MNSKIFNNTLESIGRQLSNLRRKKGYASIKEFARDFKLPEIQYWRIEKGKANFTVKSLMKLLTIHQIGMNDFFCRIRTTGKPGKF